MWGSLKLWHGNNIVLLTFKFIHLNDKNIFIINIYFIISKMVITPSVGSHKEEQKILKF